MSALPDSAFPRCLVCGKIEREPDGARVLHEVKGYTRPRTQGGANHIIGRMPTGRVVGACCAEKVLGNRTGQGDLF